MARPDMTNIETKRIVLKIAKPTLLALGLALLLALVHQQTSEVIAENQQQHEQQMLRDMVGDVALHEIENGYEFRNGEVPGGYIRKVTTDAGYNGRIELLVAHDMAGKVLGVRTTFHRETPGLGDKIELRVSDWITQFEGHSATGSQWALSPRGDFDGITGATITSQATLDAVREALER